MVDDFHTLFKKDADIARRISPARSNNPFGNSNFATTASGKLAMLRIKLLFEVAMRNMPDVFWLPANWTNAFKSAALKYHLEHALTRSNTISEFKTNFTHNVKRSQHTPQTQRLIKQITQGLDGLEKDAQELAKMSDDELTLRGIFGENYAEFKGKGQEAINHLLETKSGQVQGAFHRDDLGEINLVWGQVTDAKKHKGYGLAHIVDKHGEQAARQIPQIIKDGKLAKDTQGRLRIETQSHIVGINDTYGDEKIGHWIVTSYEKKGDGVSSSTSSPITTPKVQGENPLNEIIPNSQKQSQAPQKSLLEQARENTERLRAAQEAEQIAQKEAELARLKEMQAKNAEILAQKEAAAGQAINEAQSLEIGTPIKAQKISDTKIIINDNTAPFKAEFIITKKDDIKPNFERTGTQGRSERQDKVIESIQSDFKPHLIFEQMGGFEGLPIILKDGQVIAGNHRAQAIKGLTGENLARYKQAAKEKFGIDLKDDEVIVRLVKDGDEKELINLAFMSNVGRESNLGEKALANLAKYDSQIQALPNRINADSVFELESQVAKALDTQGNGLNVFDTNLALFSRLAKSTQNANILDSLNALKNLSQDEKEKVLRMFVSNAGEFHNLAKDTQLKSLNLNDYLADALIVAAKNVDSTTRAVNYAKLLDDIITMQASAKEMLKIDPFLFENFKSKALGYALARFARLENPSAKLFEFLKASKADLENLYTGNIFESNKAISDIDIYDFLKHAINSGEDLIDKQGRNIKGEITSRLDDLRKVENALIDSGEIQFAKSKAKPQGREAKETSINSLFADDELQMQATKPAKELNLSDEKDFNELSEFFKLNSKDKEFNEIFAKATKAAQKLGVKVKFDESAARSHFILNDNTITIAAANKEHFQAQDLLHELIHATTRKALKDFNENPAKAAQTYTKRQIEAINEIISLYQKSKGIAKRQGKDTYALQNVDEFVAELSSGEFRAFLKAQDIFERFIKALIRFFTGDSEKLAKNVNSYKALKESYYKILDDYEPPLAPQKIADERAFDRTFAIQKTARYVDDYAKTSDFKALDSDKQEAILRLKEIEPSPMPKDLKAKIDNENIITHFSKHLDSEERKFYYKLFDDAKEKPDFVLLSKDGETIEYIKAYEHTAQKDMYYLAFTQSDDNIKITGIPTTQLRKVVKDIAQSKKVVKAEDLGGILELRQADKIQSPQLADEIIPNSKGQSQVKDKKEIIAQKLDIVDKFDEKQYTLWNSELHRELTELQDKINKSDGKNLGIMGGDLKDKDVMSFFISMRYDVFANLFKEAKLPYESCKKIKELIKKGKKIDFNDRNLSRAINKFENPLAFAQTYTSTRLPQPFKNNLHKELEKILKKIESKSQENIQEFKRALKSYDSELKRLNKELEYTETLLHKINERGMIDKLNDLRDEILAQKRELLKQDPFKFQKVSQRVSHINQNNDIMSEISHKGGQQDGTSNASNGLNAAEKGMPTSEPERISDGLFGKEQLSNEPRGAGADFSNSPTHRQQPQTLFSQGASEPNASGGQQRGSNERLRTASGDLRGEVSGDGQNLQAQQGHNVSERFGQDRSEQHSRAKHTIRANSSSGASHSNATAQELVSDTNAAGILSPAEKATIENQTFTQTIDPAKFNANEILSANILTKNYDKEHLNELIDAGNDIVRLAQLAKNGNKTAERILQNYHTEAVGRGYSGYSMSVNAVEAQENGVKPLSKFNAKDAKEVSEILNEKISTNELKNLLSEFGDTGEWHHTSKFYNKTPHYSVAEMFLSLDKVKKRLALKNTKKDIIKANTQLYNDYISQIDKAAEFVKNAKDIDKSWVLSWFRERKMNAKNYLERENKFGTKAEFDVINEAFKVKTLENHPQFNALFIQQNKENLQNLAKISSGNLEKGQDLDLKNKTLQEIMLKNEKIINYAFLKQIADDLPPAFSKDEFIKALAPNAKGRANIKTPIKDIEINAEQAWEHLLDNSKGEDRTKIGGGLLQTLKKPFFVTKNNEGSYYFISPLKMKEAF
mgnify:CR=1 FL=1